MGDENSKDKLQHTNRLIHEKSPYLLQHAHNPVDWYPWCEEAFLAAKDQDKPIFLSVGYATCHWCHVMEKESFEDPQVARVLNETFINIKVDREELPEVDSLYMEFAQGMMSGSAGWPLNLILTCELHPIFAATYLPPINRQGMMGIVDLANHIQEVWKGDEREKLIEQADKIVEVFRDSQDHDVGNTPGKEEIDNTSEIFYKIADPTWGGLKGAPKFPLAYQNTFLLRYSTIRQDGRALFLVEKTLEKMSQGGIWDHLGGGFARYSVDEKWEIPHFEKMLYDNALLASTFTEAYLAEKKPLYSAVATGILDYIINEMQGDEGGFHSAEDADSEGQEGLFYTWTVDEVKDALDPKWGDLICLYYDITPGGNFEGRSVMHTPDTINEFCQKYGINEDQFSEQVVLAKSKLSEIRKKRIHPFKDDKVLTSWNGLMIHSLAEAGMVLGNKEYYDQAMKATHFILNTLWDGDYLLHRYRDGEALYNGSLDDYAFMIRALLTLFEISGNSIYLEWVNTFSRIVESLFSIPEGGFYQTDGLDANLIVRKSQFADGAEPSGNSIHCENLLRLYQITRDANYLRQAEGIFQAIEKQLGSYSPGYTYHVMNLMRYYDKKAPTFVIVLGEEEGAKDTLNQAIYSTYIPHKSVVLCDKEDAKITQLLPYLNQLDGLEDKSTLYLCTQDRCEEPVVGIDNIIEKIHSC